MQKEEFLLNRLLNCPTYLIFCKIFPFKNVRYLRFLFLLSCWIILFFSASEINKFINKVDAQTVPSGSYHDAPGLALTGSNYQDVAGTNSLQLSQFSVAVWFKTSTNFVSDAFIVNKGGDGSDSSGQNMNYGIWMTKSEKIKVWI